MRTPFASDNWEFINGKWVEINPKTKKPFTKEERKALSKLNQGRYPGSLDPLIKGDFASHGNLPEWIFKNVGRPVGDALTDAVNMLQVSPELSSKGKYQSKFQQKGPAKVQRSLREQSELFAKQQRNAQQFFGTGEFVSKDDIKNRYLNNTGELKEVNSDNRGKTEGLLDSTETPNATLKPVESKQSPKLSKEEWLAKEGKKWEIATKRSPAAQSGAWKKPGERWEIQKKANEKRWDKKYESYLKKDETPQLEQNIEESKDATKKTSIENIGASALKGVWDQTAIGSTINKVKKVADIAKSINKVGLNKTVANAVNTKKAAIAGFDPISLLISMAVSKAAAANAGPTRGAQGSGYQALPDEPDEETIFQDELFPYA